MLAKQIAKRLVKLEGAHENTASVEDVAGPKTGRSAIIAGVGLLMLLLGGAVGGGIGGLLALFGLIAFLVGLVLIVVHLVNGD